MNRVHKSPWRHWVTFSEVAFALAIGLCLFVLLNIASAGVLATLIVFAVCFAALAAGHYLLWGHEFSSEVHPEIPHVERHTPVIDPHTVSGHEFFVNLNDTERRELIQVLERSLRDPAMDSTARAYRQELVEKIRMFDRA